MEGSEVLKGQLDIFGLAESEEITEKVVEFLKDRTDVYFLFIKGSRFKVNKEDEYSYTIRIGRYLYSLDKDNFKVVI